MSTILLYVLRWGCLEEISHYEVFNGDGHDKVSWNKPCGVEHCPDRGQCYTKIHYSAFWPQRWKSSGENIFSLLLAILFFHHQPWLKILNSWKNYKALRPRFVSVSNTFYFRTHFELNVFVLYLHPDRGSRKRRYFVVWDAPRRSHVGKDNHWRI
jgi:hypothetical protein